jgi:hypothetical protein
MLAQIGRDERAFAHDFQVLRAHEFKRTLDQCRPDPAAARFGRDLATRRVRSRRSSSPKCERRLAQNSVVSRL